MYIHSSKSVQGYRLLSLLQTELISISEYIENAICSGNNHSLVKSFLLSLLYGFTSVVRCFYFYQLLQHRNLFQKGYLTFLDFYFTCFHVFHQP